MTLEELKNEVDATANGEDIVNVKSLVTAANGALRELYLTIPITKTVRFNVRGYEPVTHYQEIVCKANQSITIPMNGVAYSMRVVGRGNYIIKDGTTNNAGQFDTGTDSQLIRGYISPNSTIRFWSGFTFVIYDLSVFDEAYGPDVDNIPDGSPIKVINIREMFDDFLMFTSHPTDRYGQVIDGCRLYEDQMEISSSYSGEVAISYRRQPKPVTYCEDNDIITLAEILDIKDEYIQPLVYLTCYHFWRNIDEARAKIYKERYEIVADAIRNEKRIFDRSYVDLNGWA